MAKPGTQSGAVEHRFHGCAPIRLSEETREFAELLRQEALVRRDFGEEGVRRFWEALARRDGEPLSACSNPPES